MSNVINHLYITATILFGLYSQLIMRWQVSLAGELPLDTLGKFYFVVKLLLNPWVFSSILATFLAGVSWMLTMTKFEISYAYPFTSLQFVFILALGVLFFGESFSWMKMAGTILVIIGLIIIVKG